MLSTPLTRLLGIDHPIIQAGMGSEAGPALAAAVSNAGGLGTLGTIGLSPRAVRAAITELRTLTPRPFAVNVITFDWAPFAAELLEAAIDERVPCITLSFGDPLSALGRCRRGEYPRDRAGARVRHSEARARRAAGGADRHRETKPADTPASAGR